MPKILRFGINSLDALFGDTGEAPGIKLTGDGKGATSLCILGPDGTGKSVLALHLASRYLADCLDESEAGFVPRVLYVSTDLRRDMAELMWRNFLLDQPNRR